MFATRETITEPAEAPVEAAEQSIAPTEPSLRIVPAAEAAQAITEVVHAVEPPESATRRWRPTLGWLQDLFDVLAEPRPADDDDRRGSSYPF